MRSLTICALSLALLACTQEIELFPSSPQPDAGCVPGSSSDGGCGCVPSFAAGGTLIPCVCKLPCQTDSDCPASSAVCDATVGLCNSHGASCRTRSDCPVDSDPTHPRLASWLCLSAK